jgi:hypothetical protein
MEGLAHLKKPEVFSLGILDSFYSCSIQIFIFVWTPVLQDTASNKNINPGMIYLVMLINVLIQNKLLELLHRSIKINFFILASFYLFFYIGNWFFVYLAKDFPTRLICLSLINVYPTNLGLWRIV